MRLGRATAITALTFTLIPAFAGPALADHTRKHTTFRVNAVTASCAGDTVSATANITTNPGAGVTFTLLARHGQASFGPTSTQTIEIDRGTADHSVQFNVVGQPLTVTEYKVAVSHGTLPAAESAPVAAASCAPGEEIPEVPVAVLLPLSLAMTAGAVFAFRRRLSTVQNA